MAESLRDIKSDKLAAFVLRSIENWPLPYWPLGREQF
jgi:hypothetical protein